VEAGAVTSGSVTQGIHTVFASVSASWCLDIKQTYCNIAPPDEKMPRPRRRLWRRLLAYLLRN